MVEHDRAPAILCALDCRSGPVKNWLLLKAGPAISTGRAVHATIRAAPAGGASKCGVRTQGGNLMGIIWTLIIGLLAGIVAKLLMPGRDPGGFIITMLLGVAGAFVATYLGQAVGWYQANQGAGFIGAVVGAIILLAIYRMVKR
jgi:uncharacterized membrane protein YeaQ/YmgE (transglycosylase-associated protein family)